jgi:hypothetical protein
LTEAAGPRGESSPNDPSAAREEIRA